MILIQLYSMKEYFSEYKIAGISAKLVGDVFVEYGNVLTPFKSHHFQNAHSMNSLSSRGSPFPEVFI